MFSRFASGADGCLLVATHAIGLPELAISWCLAVSHPAPVPVTRWFCFGLAVSQMLFRPRVWPGRTQVFGLPGLAISWCLTVMHPALVPYVRFWMFLVEPIFVVFCKDKSCSVFQDPRSLFADRIGCWTSLSIWPLALDSYPATCLCRLHLLATGRACMGDATCNNTIPDSKLLATTQPLSHFPTPRCCRFSKGFASASCNQNSTLLKHLQDEQQSP